MAASAASLAMAAIEASAASCAHCGTQVLALKKCSICKQVGYCGAECQKAGWKGHKTCARPLPIKNVFQKVMAAHEANDWRGVLKFEGRMEEMMERRRMAVMMEGAADEYCEKVLYIFSSAHALANCSMASAWTGWCGHALSNIRLLGRRVELLGNLERFRDQGEVLCNIANQLRMVNSQEEATRFSMHQAMLCVSLLVLDLPTEFFLHRFYNRARDVGAAHGFFSVECRSCLGLGQMAVDDGREEEGLELLRNALAGPFTPCHLTETRNPKP